VSLAIIDKYDDINLQKWDQFIKTHKEGNFFQTSSAYQFFRKVENYDPYIVLVESEGSYQGCLLAVVIREQSIKGYFSSRAIITGGPIVNKGEIGTFKLLLNRMNSLLKGKAIFIEIRNLFEIETDKSKVLENEGFKFLPYQNFLVPLKKLKNADLTISNSKKRQIRNSLRNGARITEVETVDEIVKFYKILYDLYKGRVKKPLPAFGFFKTFFESPELGKIFLIKSDDEVLGGIVCPIFDNRIIYEWYIAGRSDGTPGIYPGVLATWAPIEYGMENGFEVFDFMGAGRSDKDYGVREFKSKFGVETVEFGRYRRINNHFMWAIANAGLKTLSFLRKL
jgi:lipid II:glycine glycyltransferase (peptidoglycan interpeptide bridge formation enzyme)